MTMTQHAQIRQQQRGLPPLTIELLERFGSREHAHDGSEILYFDKHARKRVASYAGGLFGKVSELLDAYAIMAEGRVITVGHRYRRINHR